jgi:hypothetical protein
MNAEISESVQHAVNPGMVEDMYYPGNSNSKVQAFPSTMENRFNVALPSLNQNSSSTIIFSPDEGLGDIVLSVTLPIAGTPSYANWAFNTGWLYQMIDTLGIRIGGSSLYYFTGDQLLAESLHECDNGTKRDQLLQLGGTQINGATAFGVKSNLSASIYLKCPWNSPSALQKPLPLPTDCLTQPVQLILKFKNFSDIAFATATASSTANLPTSFDSASVTFRQVHLSDSSHLLSRRYNLNQHALAFPLRYFPQTTFRTTISTDGSSSVPINLTGFRSGSVKAIRLWIVPAAANAAASATISITGGPGNTNNWVNPVAVNLSVNGLVYYQSTNYSSLIWGLIDGKFPGGVNSNYYFQTAGGTATTASQGTVFNSYVYIPLAQETTPLGGENALSLGLAIQNAVVNLTLQMPATSSALSYIVSAEYLYASTLMFSKGTCEYVF